MKLVCDAPVGVTIDELDRRPADVDEVRRLFDFLEFHSLGERLTEAVGEDLGLGGAPAEVLEAEVSEVTTPADAVALMEAVRSGGEGAPLAVAAAWSGSEGRTPLEGLALVTDAAAGEVGWLPGDVLADSGVQAALSALTALPDAGGRPLAAHQAKAVMRSLFDLGVDVRCLGLDTAIAAYLLDPAESRYLLDEVLRRYAGAELPTDGAAAEGQLDLDGSGVSAALRTARYALAVERLIEPLTRALDDQSLRELNDAIEVPLVRVLARMEHVGVGVDAAELRKLRDRLSSEVESLRARIWEDAGTEFNVNSTPQLREILFDKLGLAPQKKTKTGYSTDASSLEKLAGQHEIIDHLLAYREVEKLRSTYGDGLLAEVAPDGRIHATFNQTVARTGRLSSDQPNLHNIPVRSEIGRTFRRAFVPAPGCELLVADYNQIELRCIAHLAEDPGLIESFRARRDIHTETASRVFGVEPGEVTIEQRSKAKMVSYGLAYGMESYGLGQRLNIPTEEAALILAAYFEAFPAVRDYMDRTVAEARQRGYTETLFGRRRQIPELSSPNFRIRQAGERQAMNAGIQGLAADIFKVALVRIETALEEAAMASRLILQVHDEVLLDVPPAEREAATDLVVEAMSHAVELSVPLEVNLAFGPTWADAKG
jgi:DNA polymerase-1